MARERGEYRKLEQEDTGGGRVECVEQVRRRQERDLRKRKFLTRENSWTKT